MLQYCRRMWALENSKEVSMMMLSTSNKVFHNSPPRYSSLFKKMSAMLGFTIGAIAIVFAAVSFITNMQINDLLAWVNQYFGVTFSVLFTLLVGTSILSIIRVSQQCRTVFWSQVGAQAANAISTLALTFTLLGISLGIGALSDQALTPDNVNNVISMLTTQFSMAFMTTVIGLPTATAVRASVAILLAKQINVGA